MRPNQRIKLTDVSAEQFNAHTRKNIIHSHARGSASRRNSTPQLMREPLAGETMKSHITYRAVLLSTCFCVCFQIGVAQQSEQVTRKTPQLDSLTSVLQEISRKGAMLYSYDQACHIATDLVFARSTNRDRLGLYLAYKDSSGWRVGFGKISMDSSFFELAYQVQFSGNLSASDCKEYSPATLDNRTYLPLARAVSLVIDNFPPRSSEHTYNYAVLPTGSNNVDVYVYPAQTHNGIYPLGGDDRYTISLASNSIVDVKILHKSVLDLATPLETEKLAASGSRSILSSTPVETDVLLVLLRRPRFPHYVVTKDTAAFWIDTTGSITRKNGPLLLPRKN